jgi:hypothetical protein
VNRQLTQQQIENLIRTGKGRMPGFPKLRQEQMIALLWFLATDDLSAGASAAPSSVAEVGHHLFQRNCAFAMDGTRRVAKPGLT